MRINLKWQGKHDLADFDVDRLGKVVSSDIETEHTGWVVIEPRRTVKPEDTIPLRKIRWEEKRAQACWALKTSF